MIYQWRKHERKYMPMNYFKKSITEGVRRVLVDWMGEVAVEYNLKHETLFHATNLLDRYQTQASVSRKQFQLLGCACLALAGKYEEIDPPSTDDYVYITAETYTFQEIIDMELKVLKQLDYNVSTMHIHTCMPLYLLAAEMEGKQVHMANYIAEVTLLYAKFFKYCPSLLAAGIVYYVRAITSNDETWVRYVALNKA